MLTREDIKIGTWFKKMGSTIANYRFTFMPEDGKTAGYEYCFDNYACCEDMVGKGRGIKEWVGGQVHPIDHFLTSEEFEPKGDSPTYYEEYDASMFSTPNPYVIQLPKATCPNCKHTF